MFLILQEYELQGVHRLGLVNYDEDELIRKPCTSQQDGACGMVSMMKRW